MKLKIVLFSVLYFILAKISLLLALDDGYASLVWMGSGFSLCLFLFYGNRIWPAIAIGAFLINFSIGDSLVFSSIVAAGNTLEALAAYSLLNYWIGKDVLFEKLKTFRFFIYASILGSTISASFGCLAMLTLPDNDFDFLKTFATWWLGDFSSFLLIVPLIVLYSKNALFNLFQTKTLISFLVLILLCFFTFFIEFKSNLVAVVFVYSLFIFPLRASLIYSRLSAILQVFVISVFAIVATIFGKGPFVFENLNNSLFMIQSFIAILTMITLVVSVGVKEREMVEEKLSGLLIEKDALIAEIHHRVKNNLSIVSGLLYLQSETMQDEGFRKKMDQTQLRVKAIALVHEKLYQNSKLKFIEFSDYVKKLSEMIQRIHESSNNPIKLTLDLEEIDLSIEKALPLGLITNELLTNSYKHAFEGAEEGEIKIILKTINNKLFLSISDNGRGYDVEKEFDLDSLGLTLITTLAKQINAILEIKNENGAKYEFTLNLEE